MKKRFFAFLCTLVLLCGAALSCFAEDYTVAEKLVKQLWAGSGFSGNVNITLEFDGLRTAKPIELSVDAVYVRPTETDKGKQRLEVRLEKDGKTQSTLYAQFDQTGVSFQSDIISPDWYRINQAQDSLTDSLAFTGIPATAETLLTLAGKLKDNEKAENAFAPYLTRIDVWLDAYRGEVELSKAEDGTTVLTTEYVIAPQAIKAQLKQLIVDLLQDEALITALIDAIGEEETAPYLLPTLQDHYFSAVDALPISKPLELSRRVTVKGELLNERLVLPITDAVTGESLLTYETGLASDGTQKVSFTLKSEKQQLDAEYTFDEKDDARVWDGTIRYEAENAEPLSLHFTLEGKTTESTETDGRNRYECAWVLTLEPIGEEEAEPTVLALNAAFISKELKSAATEISAELSITSGSDKASITLDGASRKKWVPEEVPSLQTDIATLTESDVNAITAQTVTKLLTVLEDVLEAPAEEAAQEPSEVPEEEAAQEPSKAPAD